jgi:PleD family two-component response regulator
MTAGRQDNTCSVDDGETGEDVTNAPVILIVSAYEWASRALDTVLAPRGYAILRAYTAKQAIERVVHGNPDAVFVDHLLPDQDGLELCRTLVSEGYLSAAAPLFLMRPDPAPRDVRIRALRAGVWDTLSFPFDAEELTLHLERFVQAKCAIDDAERRAIVDRVSGVYTLEGLLRRAGEITAGASRYGRPIACVVITLEGLQAGSTTRSTPRRWSSEADRRVVDSLRQSMRRSDVIGKGDYNHFIVIAPDTDRKGAEVLTERLQAKVSTYAPKARHFAVSDMADLSKELAGFLAQLSKGDPLDDSWTN